MSKLPLLLVPRIAHTFPIDANLNKAPWTRLAPIPLAASHGRDPENRARSVQPTALRICHDGERLYVAFDCEDRDAWGTLGGRNQPIYEEEVVEAFLAPSADPRRYFELESSPRGAYFEAIIDNPDGARRTMRTNLDWVCEGWERAVRVHGVEAGRSGEGWSVEWAIPFASLGVAPPKPGERWRANVLRIDRPRGARGQGGEFSAWSPTFAEPADFHVPDRFGALELE
ncbi:MAG TPA: carbohydrate-binding family 9-like protein [Myxococcota bacterium]|nr:carbohydrate-binding family 9-like protein [Myxococcota bacterium]